MSLQTTAPEYNTNNVFSVLPAKLAQTNKFLAKRGQLDALCREAGLHTRRSGDRECLDVFRGDEHVGYYVLTDKQFIFNEPIEMPITRRRLRPGKSYDPVQLLSHIKDIREDILVDELEHVMLETKKTVDPGELGLEVNQEIKKRRAKELADEIEAAKKAADMVSRLGTPRIMDGEAFMAQASNPVRWRVEKLWNEGGQVLLYAAAKVGKSTFAHNLIEALTTGRAFLDSYDVTKPQGRVTLIDFELDPDRLREELGHYDLDLSRLNIVPMRHLGASQFNPLNDQNRQEWATRLQESDTEILIIDCLGPIIRTAGKDPNTEGGHMLDAIIELCAEAGVKSHLVIDHASSKTYATENGPRGDSTKLDIPDHIWHLAQNKDKSFSLTTTGRSEGIELDLVRNGYVFTPVEGTALKTPAELNAHKLRNKFLETIEEYNRKQINDGVEEESCKAWPPTKYVIDSVKGHAQAKYGLGRPAVATALDYLIGSGDISQLPGARKDNFVLKPGRTAVGVATSERRRFESRAQQNGVDSNVIHLFVNGTQE